MIVFAIIVFCIICLVAFYRETGKNEKQADVKIADFSKTKPEKPMTAVQPLNTASTETKASSPIIEKKENTGVPLPSAPKPTMEKRQMTPLMIENERIKEGILDNMENGVRYTIADMLITFDCFPEAMTPNRLSALLSQLGPRGTQQIERTEQDGKAYFSLPSDKAPAGMKVSTTAKSEEPVGTDNDKPVNTPALTPHQLENQSIKKGIIYNMEEGVMYAIADMLITFDCFPEAMSANRLSALLSQLGPYGTQQVERTEEKGKAYFTLSPKGIQEKTMISQDYRVNIGTYSSSSAHLSSRLSTGTTSGYSGSYNYQSGGTGKKKQKREYFTDWDGKKYYYDKNGNKTYKRETVYYTDWDGRKYYYDKNGVKKYKQERTYYKDWDGREYYYDKNGEKKYRGERKKKEEDYYDDPFNDPRHYNNFQNGPTDHGTFIGNCKICGTTWEFKSYKVIPRPYPHATCPNCHNWVAVF